MSDKTAIITGAARGIGLATARLLSERGWRVVLADIDADELDRVAPTVLGTYAIACDVSDPDQVEALIARTVDWSGRIDALVNNAGVADFRPMGDTDLATWRRIMAVNLDGVFLCSQAAVPHLARTGGAIVNIASISGLPASTLRVAHGTSTTAVIHLTCQQAAELGKLRGPRPGRHQAGLGGAQPGDPLALS